MGERLMFGLDIFEILIIAAVALIFLKPEDLPRAFRRLGKFYAQVTGMKNSLVNSFKEMEEDANVKNASPEGDDQDKKDKEEEH
jgi:Sec-independent protein translocase protein TatA